MYVTAFYRKNSIRMWFQNATFSKMACILRTNSNKNFGNGIFNFNMAPRSQIPAVTYAILHILNHKNEYCSTNECYENY